MGDEGITKAFLEVRKALVRRIRSLINDPMEIEDIVQEAYVRSLVANRARTIESPKAYIAKSARNIALNYIKSAQSKMVDVLGDVEVADTSIGIGGLEEQRGFNEDLEIVCRAIEQLPVRCRRVLTLRQVYGLSQKEIARKLGISEKTVEYHVSKGLLSCRRYIRIRRQGDAGEHKTIKSNRTKASGK